MRNRYNVDFGNSRNDSIIVIASGLSTFFLPYLKNIIDAQAYTVGQSLNYTQPYNTFFEDDVNNTLKYSISNGFYIFKFS